MPVDSIREGLPIEGKRVVMVTCEDDPGTEGQPLYLHFDDGSTATFFIEGRGFGYDGFPEDHPLRKEAEDEGEE